MIVYIIVYKFITFPFSNERSSYISDGLRKIIFCASYQFELFRNHLAYLKPCAKPYNFSSQLSMVEINHSVLGKRLTVREVSDNDCDEEKKCTDQRSRMLTKGLMAAKKTRNSSG